MARVELADSWTTPLQGDELNAALASFFRVHEMQMTRVEEGRIEAKQGSRLKQNFGGSYVNERTLPKTATVSMTPSTDGTRIEARIESIWFWLLDRKTRRKYDAYFRQWMFSLKAELPRQPRGGTTGLPSQPRGGTTSSVPFRIFLSYRREDSQDAAGRLYDQLAVEFGEDHVFLDVDAIPAGVDFVDHINEAVGRADVFVALIGRGWLDAADESGRRRLDDEADFVRLELEAALARAIPVIPTLVRSAGPPAAAALPESLAKLARIQAQALSHERWRYDSGQLIARLKEIQSDKASRLGLSPSQAAASQAPGGHAGQASADSGHETAFLLRRFGPRKGLTVVGLVALVMFIAGFLLGDTRSGPYDEYLAFFMMGLGISGLIFDRVALRFRPRKP